MVKNVKVLITGAAGQLGRELQSTAPVKAILFSLSRSDLDISSRDQVRNVISEIRPDVVINASAYTAVDQAEKEPERAYAVNRDGPGNLAQVAAQNNIYFVHLSTDFVFSGSLSRPYEPDGPLDPVNLYGRSKLEGELAVKQAALDRFLIVRTSWLYSSYGNNFVKNMLDLMKKRERLAVVADQIGSPTWGRSLAKALWDMTNKEMKGVQHWTDAGVASWYDFAVAIQEESCSLGLLKKTIPVYPIPSYEFPALAKRPSFSVLEKSQTWKALGYCSEHWRKNLRLMLAEMNENRNETEHGHIKIDMS